MRFDNNVIIKNSQVSIILSDYNFKLKNINI